MVEKLIIWSAYCVHGGSSPSRRHMIAGVYVLAFGGGGSERRPLQVGAAATEAWRQQKRAIRAREARSRRGEESPRAQFTAVPSSSEVRAFSPLPAADSRHVRARRAGAPSCGRRRLPRLLLIPVTARSMCTARYRYPDLAWPPGRGLDSNAAPILSPPYLPWAKVAGHCGASVPVSVHARCPQNIVCASKVVRGCSVPRAPACSYTRMPPPDRPDPEDTVCSFILPFITKTAQTVNAHAPCMLETIAIVLFMTQKVLVL